MADKLRRPLNAPPGITPAPGVQPGTTTGIIFARYVIVFGPTDSVTGVFVYAAGGYYYPGKNLDALRAEMRSYLDRGYTVVKMKIGNGIAQDQPRLEGVLK